MKILDKINKIAEQFTSNGSFNKLFIKSINECHFFIKNNIVKNPINTNVFRYFYSQKELIIVI